jgi:uracil-DNA glycosylase
LRFICSGERINRWPRNIKMFRAELQQLASGPVLKMEGRLVGDWARQARVLVMSDTVPKGLVVDLTEVSFADSAGEQVLSWLSSIGAEFVANNIYAAALCERLCLPLQKKSSPERLKRTASGPSPKHTRAG